MCRAQPRIPRRVAVHQEYAHVETIVPAEKEVIAIHEDNAQLHNVVVLRAVIDVPRVADCRTELVPHKVNEPEVEEVIEAVEHQAVVDASST